MQYDNFPRKIVTDRSNNISMDWDCRTLDHVVEQMKGYLEQYGPDARIYVYSGSSWDDSESYVEICYNRPETDEEYEKRYQKWLKGKEAKSRRLQKKLEQQALAEEEEKALFEQLYAKYGHMLRGES